MRSVIEIGLMMHFTINLPTQNPPLGKRPVHFIAETPAMPGHFREGSATLDLEAGCW